MASEAQKETKEVTAAKPVAVRRDDRYPLSALRTEMDRLIDDFFHRAPMLRGRDVFDWEPFGRFERESGIAPPRVDFSETDKGYEVVAELPGLDQKDIALELKDDILTLSGEKKEEQEKKEKDYHLSERRFGSFRRAIRLPSEVDQDKVSAEFKNGVLSVSLPKTAKAQKPSKKIGIKSK